MRLPLFLFLLLSLAVMACQKPMPEKSMWEGTVTLAEEKQLPFRFSLDLRSEHPRGSFIVSAEATEIPEIRKSGDSLSMIISEYSAALVGRWDGQTWTGQFLRYRRDTIALPFSAQPETAPQEPPKEPPGVRLVGSFQVHYQEDEGIDSASAAKFWVRGDSVFGTIIDPSGDHGLMAGLQSGTKARLGRFIGWQANLIELEYRDGRWNGRYYARQNPPDIFTLVPRPADAPNPSKTRKTTLKRPGSGFSFEGISIDGDTVRSSDERFRGKALIVDIMGTWCHNCLDEAPVLRQLYSEFQDDGLEIVGLSFEITDDPKIGRKNLAIYRDRHQISFPLLYAGSLDAENVRRRLHAQLDGFFAYPTTLFVDRKGTVKEIHWGFQGPGTGENYQREIEHFYASTRSILK